MYCVLSLVLSCISLILSLAANISVRKNTGISELQMKESIEDISKIFFLVSQRKHML